MSIYHTKILREIDKTLIAQWKKLWAKAENANAFNSYEWFVTSKEAGKIESYEIFACYDQEMLVAIFPLCPSRSYGVNVWVPMGDEFIVDTAFLIEKYDPEICKSLFKQIFIHKNIYITTLDEKATTLLKKVFPQLFFSLISVNPYIDFQNDPLRFLSGSQRRKMKPILKENQDHLHFKKYTAEDNLEDHLEKIFEIEQQSAKKLHAKDVFSKQENIDFYRTMLKHCRKFVVIYFLYYDEIPFVYGFCLRYGSKVVGYQTSYLATYRNFSPGKIMLKYSLEDMMDDGVDTFDFGGGVSAYKQAFTPQYFYLYNLYHSGNPFIMMWWKAINAVRRGKQVLFPQKFTKDHQFLFKTFSQVSSQEKTYA